MSINSNKSVLILGSNGRFGSACLHEFTKNNWNVRVFNRKTDNLLECSQGVDFILMGWNPQYPDWETQIPAQTQQVISAAKSSGARIIIPGNVYVYGRTLGLKTREQTSHEAQNSLGKIRRQMEFDYTNASLKTLIVRAGDFIDTSASGNWFDMVMCKKLRKGQFTYPGCVNSKHAFAYLPDLARAVRMLCEKSDQLDQNAEFTFAGYTLTGKELKLLAAPYAKLKRFPWWSIQLARPFWPLAKHLLEMRYLWEVEHSLDETKFKKFLPNFVATPIEKAMIEATKSFR